MYINAFDTVVYWKVFYIIMIIIMIMMIMIIIIMVMIIILYTFLFKSCSSHVTCFQEWNYEKCYGIFNFKRNYQYHMKSCSGVNKYKCEKCGNEYNSKKSLCGHRRKQHGNDICCFTFFVENLHYINFSHIL